VLGRYRQYKSHEPALPGSTESFLIPIFLELLLFSTFIEKHFTLPTKPLGDLATVSITQRKQIDLYHTSAMKANAAHILFALVALLFPTIYGLPNAQTTVLSIPAISVSTKYHSGVYLASFESTATTSSLLPASSPITNTGPQKRSVTPNNGHAGRICNLNCKEGDIVCKALAWGYCESDGCANLDYVPPGQVCFQGALMTAEAANAANALPHPGFGGHCGSDCTPGKIWCFSETSYGTCWANPQCAVPRPVPGGYLCQNGQLVAIEKMRAVGAGSSSASAAFLSSTAAPVTTAPSYVSQTSPFTRKTGVDCRLAPIWCFSLTWVGYCRTEKEGDTMGVGFADPVPVMNGTICVNGTLSVSAAPPTASPQTISKTRRSPADECKNYNCADGAEVFCYSGSTFGICDGNGCAGDRQPVPGNAYCSADQLFKLPSKTKRGDAAAVAAKSSSIITPSIPVATPPSPVSPPKVAAPAADCKNYNCAAGAGVFCYSGWFFGYCDSQGCAGDRQLVPPNMYCAEDQLLCDPVQSVFGPGVQWPCPGVTNA